MKTKPEQIKADIVDNTNKITMEKILNSTIPHVTQLDISTGYFDVAGYGMLRESLEDSAKDDSFAMRLLLGRDAILPSKSSFEKYAQEYQKIQENTDILSVKSNLDNSEFTLKSRTDTTSLINLLKQENVQIRLGAARFNHSKCYILGSDSVFIGSSNFTRGGLIGNYELNAGLYQPGIAKQTREWFDRMWKDATDTKKDLIAVLQQSKFGMPSIPFEVYMKILFERYKPLLADMGSDTTFSATLTKFQQDAVRTGMFITSEFGGVIIADATGLGKTNMGIEILRQKILKEGKKALLIAPAQVLHSMWEEKLKDVDIKVREMLTMESLGREDILENLGKYRNIDLILIDESQNFRSKNTNRRKNLMKLMAVGKRKQAILLSATPINNSLMDLYYQLSIITGGNDQYFYKSIGIPDLYNHMRKAANAEGLDLGLEKIQQLLDNVMVRRTRSFIKQVYKDDQINGTDIKFPKHEYSPIRYSLSKLFGNVFEKILEDIGKLSMAPYGIEQYNMTLSEDEKNKHKVLAHLQIILLLKRFESSVRAVKVSLDNKIKLYHHIRNVLNEGKILRVKDFNRVLTKWNEPDVNDPDIDTDEKDKANFFISEIKNIEKDKADKTYDLEKLKEDMDKDISILNVLLSKIEEITIDKKLDAVEETIIREKALDKESKKVLIFTEYTETAKYITHDLKHKFPKHNIRCITGKTDQKTRKQYIRQFAPNANLLEDDEPEKEEIDILISTEVLSEGQNLQDCNYVINYDLPWNPMRIVQRTGRIDRLTSKYDVIHSRACYPDDDLDKILKLVGNLMRKISTINKTIGLDTALLGEMPNSKQFNGTAVQRIKILADGKSSDKIIKSMEHESDLMPTSSPINELSRYIKDKGIEFMKDISMGRRSGKKGQGQKAILAYLQEKPERRVYFVNYDYKTDRAVVPEDDSEIIRTISCLYDEPKYLPMDGNDSQESFEHLLDIDKKAKIAISEDNNKVLQYVKEINKNKKNLHEKNITRIKKSIIDAIMNSSITQDDGESVMSIIKSEYIHPWKDEIHDFLAEYDRSNDITTLVTEIKSLGKHIGLAEKEETIEPVEIPQNVELKLVGAMFITGDTFDPKLGTKGLKY